MSTHPPATRYNGAVPMDRKGFVFRIVLLVLLGWAGAVAWSYRRSTAEYQRLERESHATAWRIEHLRTALERVDRMSRLPPDEALINDLRGQCDELVHTATETASLSPTRDDVIWLRGRAHESRCAFDLALADYTESIRLFDAATARYVDRSNVPFSIAYGHRGMLRLRLLLRRGLSDDDDPSLRDAAFEDLRRASHNQPQSAFTSRTIWLVAMDLTRQAYAQAITNADLAGRLDPTDWRPPFYRGVARRALNQDALADLEEACLLRPCAAEAQAWRARALHDAGKLEESRRACALAALADPGYTEALLLRAAVELECRRPDPQALRSALASLTNPRRASEYVLRARMHLELGSPDAAIGDIVQAVALQGTFADAHLIHGRALEAKGDKAGARSQFEMARALAPKRAAEIDALIKSLD